MSGDDEESALASVSAAAQQQLAELLRQRGIACEERGEWLVLDGERLSVRCTAERCQSHAQGWMVQLNFTIAADEGAGVVLSDTNVGVGASLEAAIAESAEAWVDGVLAPVRQAFGEAEDDTGINIYDLVTVDIERAEETSWEAFAGPFQLRGARDRQEAVAAYLADEPPLVTLLINDLTALLTEKPAPLIWIKLLLQKPPAGPMVVECKANGEQWHEGERALAKFDWPAGSEGMLIKQFAVLKRGTSRPSQLTRENQPSQAASEGTQGQRSGCSGVLAGGILFSVAMLVLLLA
jgi:hypothetical protein